MFKKPKLDDLIILDVRWLNRRGLLSPGRHNISWNLRGQAADSIALTTIGDSIHLSFRTRHGGGEWQSVEQVAGIAWTPCHLGGKRPWFLCPRCTRRVAILYGGSLFLCRHCHGRSYESQSESPMKREFRKVRRLRGKLGSRENLFQTVWQKPKWMRWRTFERKLLELRIEEARMWRMVNAQLDALEASLSRKPPTG